MSEKIPWPCRLEEVWQMDDRTDWDWQARGEEFEVDWPPRVL